MKKDNRLILNEIKYYYKFKSDAEFARFLGIAPNTLSNWYSRNTLDYELVITKCEDINANWLLTGKGDMLLIQDTMLKEPDPVYERQKPKHFIPLIPIEAMAGYGNGEIQVNEADITEGYVIPDFDEKGVKYLIRVSGSSMYPKYSNGDLLGCKPITDLSFFQWGKCYVLDTDQGPLVKRIFEAPEPDMLLCVSENSERYPSFKIPRKSIYRTAIIVGVLRLE
ncbi:helix-turn-helix domain-containing protein [Pedobacter sp.]|uniref:LexA family transcriptional regulator n=1 Tax=Pedobacter sp. TaxID=1411316 RepID=UPI00396C648A